MTDSNAPTAFSAPPVSAIVPSFNEGKRIAQVLDILASYPGFQEVIVVDESTDDTEVIVRRYPHVRYYRQHGNDGKGQAMDQGVKHTTSDIFFFCDADITGLTHAAIDAILAPVLRGETEMSVAVRGRSVPWLTQVLARFFPLTTLIAGERAVHRRLWERVPKAHTRGFGIEQALNTVAAAEGKTIAYHLVPGMRQTVKEQKYGIRMGLARRWILVRDMVKTGALLIKERTAQNRR